MISREDYDESNIDCNNKEDVMIISRIQEGMGTLWLL